MTFQGCGIVFSRAARPLVLVVALATAACGTATMESAMTQDPSAGPVDTGTYPNLNIAPVAASEQLSPSERAAKTAELTAARQRVGTGRGGGGEDPRLKRLAGTHGQAALQAIEGE